MYSGKTVSLDQILWKIMGKGIYSQLNEEDAALYASEAIRLIGAPLAFENVVTNPPLTIVNHKATMPSDYISIRGVRFITNEDNYEDDPIAMRYATDLYHESLDSCDTEEENQSEHPLPFPKEYTYTIDHGIITTSMKEGKIQVAYKKLSTCEKGYPLVPDNMDMLYAIEYHIRWRHIEGLWEMGKIADKVYNSVSQNRDWYIGAAQSSMQLANMDHVESVMNTVNRLILPNEAHSTGFKRIGKREQIKKYS